MGFVERLPKIWLALTSCWRASRDTEAPGCRDCSTTARLNSIEWRRYGPRGPRGER